ncbi:MAG TPA: SUMF1/EgtB/PvdO family nonheme iron enzyme, partial [Patescibacteria group bacterium]|nr:SUMF1/EgtB/PvdO family nonheme iron enzyme [Patescibacteria group bacterium]
LEAPAHQRRKLQEEVAWFDKYLFGAGSGGSASSGGNDAGNDAGNEALKEGSPLDRILNAAKAAREGARFGKPERGVLVPETVSWPDAPAGPVEIGRFEVTRAQYAAFDPGYAVNEATANLPASGISFDKAKGYCEWLSARTGRRFRLPDAEEMNSLLDGVSEDPLDDVTLDYWAGYALNPEDARKLAPVIDGLPGPAPLLKPVGSMAPVKISGAGLLYDLGGNVSEWANDGAAGRALGCNAGRPCDPLSSNLQPAAQYIGFRVVTSQ